jgi:hypothetical protein
VAIIAPAFSDNFTRLVRPDDITLIFTSAIFLLLLISKNIYSRKLFYSFRLKELSGGSKAYEDLAGFPAVQENPAAS